MSLSLLSPGCRALILAVLLGATPALLSTAEAPDGHQMMLAVLKKIEARTGVENHYLGDGGLRRIEEQLAASPESSTDLDRFRLLVLARFHNLRLGRTAESITRYLEADRLLPSIESQVPREFVDEAILQLAVAYLRMGENDNCVHGSTNQSCLLPIRGGGIHRKQEGSLKAIEHLTRLVERSPDHATGRWLLNLAHMTVGSYPEKVPEKFLIPPERFASSEKFPRFLNVAPNLGLDVMSMCGGAIVDDFDNDGFLDIVVSGWGTSEQIRYFKNNGDGGFTERTEEAGLTGLYGGLNLVQADYDNDGDIDVLVLRGAWLDRAGRHPNSLLRNDGKGYFRDVTAESGLGRVHYPTQTAGWADYDNDGDLDLYIGNETFPSQLFRNNGKGLFSDVAGAAGVTNDRFAKGVTWGDYDGDRFPDIYVSNIDGDNRLYHNNGDGTFTDMAPAAGTTGPKKSFPTWFWDFNNDGALDIYVSSYEAGVIYIASDYMGTPLLVEPDHLYQGDGKGGFREVSKEMGMTRITQPMGSNFGDVDHDGYPDYYLGTGYPAYEGLMPNLLFHNQRGKGFADVTAAADVGHLQKGHGVAFADLDNDGDEDIYAELGGSFSGDAFMNALFENPGFGNHWLTVRLAGKKSNRFGVGSRIRAEITEDGEKRSVYKWVNSGGSFGANPLRLQIGLGKADTIDLLEVFWPATGETQRFENVPADQFIEITESEKDFRQMEWRTAPFKASANKAAGHDTHNQQPPTP
ncbi:MAG: CRTAC1 family protein [Acidobacteria bacterium]|nr:CRTAC1 family protein [Acidobacteriota bacterium]